MSAHMASAYISGGARTPGRVRAVFRRTAVMALMLSVTGCASHSARPDPAEAQNLEQQRLEAKRAYQAGDVQHAAELYQSLTEARSGDADLWYWLGNSRFRQQQPDEAVAAYQHAIQLRPDFVQALYNLGVVRVKQAQAAMMASAQAGKPGDVLRKGASRVAQRLAKVGEDMPARGKTDGGAPPFIVDADDTP